MVSPTRLTLRASGLYGISMFPGYVDAPYHSPILIYDLEPLGDRRFQLSYLNMRYASGVQQMSTTFETIARSTSHLLARRYPAIDRSYVFMPLTKGWIRAHFPQMDLDNPPMFEDGCPIPHAIARAFDCSI